MSRAAGILMPITSLPGKYGIGCFSKEAYAFIDWLKEAGQTSPKSRSKESAKFLTIRHKCKGHQRSC